jgi:uncharacterized protein YqeY
MPIKDDVTEKMKTAMKAKDKLSLETLRMLKAKIKQTEIDTQTELDDQAVIKLVRNQIKSRKDSAKMYVDGGRQELADKENAEIKVLEEFLPQGLSTEDLGKMVDEAINETGATSMKEMGAVMKAVMAKAQGRADGSEINKLVKERLG